MFSHSADLHSVDDCLDNYSGSFSNSLMWKGFVLFWKSYSCVSKGLHYIIAVAVVILYESLEYRNLL